MCKIIQKKTEGGFIIHRKVIDAPVNNIAYNGTEHSIKLKDSYIVILSEDDIKFIITHVPREIKNHTVRRKRRVK